ncbi:hypothetical protein [Streptomyces meridianus]|uniref:Uncharacterized protein n=1 Tax=Streptomyces meridianus TaxID=2938945 RepID=A0ABT0X661_9ACTN|nr:hypothetical protein [Streptomyces meridianus]MCM2578021.1 hypothetical protein [Streptomyces meridianus]
MSETTAHPTQCYRCPAVDDFPVYSHSIETGSGAGAILYLCRPCARQEHSDHLRQCRVCRTGINCETAESQHELLLAVRQAMVDRVRAADVRRSLMHRSAPEAWPAT